MIVGASAREAYGVHTEATYCRTEVKQTVVVSCVFTYNKKHKTAGCNDPHCCLEFWPIPAKWAKIQGVSGPTNKPAQQT